MYATAIVPFGTLGTSVTIKPCNRTRLVVSKLLIVFVCVRIVYWYWPDDGIGRRETFAGGERFTYLSLQIVADPAPCGVSRRNKTII